MLLQPRRGSDPLAGDEQTLAEALRELQEMLHLAAASTASLPRAAAPTYVRLRDTLLKSGLAGTLPGFLQQCLTIDRFQDFIHLYDRDPARRAEFLNTAFRSGTRGRKKAIRDVFSDFEF
jgi:hypothetical protein